jgi:hypothetical protein
MLTNVVFVIIYPFLAVFLYTKKYTLLINNDNLCIKFYLAINSDYIRLNGLFNLNMCDLKKHLGVLMQIPWYLW